MKSYTISADIGYSSIKASIKKANDEMKRILIPSVVAIQKPQNNLKPQVFETESQEAVYMEELLDHMDNRVILGSNANSQKTLGSAILDTRLFVGQSAIKAGIPTRAFDVSDLSGKSETDLAFVLILSIIANQIVSDAYAEGENLDDKIKANINLITALPITEGKRPGLIDAYKERFQKGKHLVTLYNFESPIVVEIKIKNVFVGLEGEVAQFKIANADEPLKDAIFNDFIENYPELENDVTKEDLVQIENVLGIDIGEGTTDIVTILNNKSNANMSTSLEVGFGNALQDAVAVLMSKSINLSSRAELNDYLNKEVSPIARQRQKHIQEIVCDQFENLVDQIIDATSETMRKVGSNVEMVYVYGGGSIPLLKQSTLKPRLIDKLKNFTGGFDIPVIFIDEQYAQTLNQAGLDLIADVYDEQKGGN